MRALRTLARGAAVVAALAAAACVSYRPVPPLDDEEGRELATLLPGLQAERVRVLAADRHALEEADDVEAALRLVGATLDAEAPTLTIEAQESWQTIEEPFFLVLTLGFFPYYGHGDLRHHWRLVAEDGRQIAGDVSMDSPAWVGWLVAPVALLPGWRLSGLLIPEEPPGESRSDARRMRIALGIARSVARLRDEK